MAYKYLTLLFFILSGNCLDYSGKLFFGLRKNFTVIRKTIGNENEINFFQHIVLPPSSFSEIDVKFNRTRGVTNDGAFTMLQIHSFQHNITLDYTGNESNLLSKNGTHFGVILRNDKKLFLLNYNRCYEVKAIIAGITYSGRAPVPGGCPMNDDSVITPELQINLLTELLKIEGNSARESSSKIGDDSEYEEDPLCLNESNRNNYHLIYVNRYLYMEKGDFSFESFSKSIHSLLLMNSGNSNSQAHKFTIRKFRNHTGNGKFEILYNAIPGTGIAANVFVQNKYGDFSGYVPVISYSCDPLFARDDCSVLSKTFGWGILASTLIIFGSLRLCLVCRDEYVNLIINSFFLGCYGTQISLSLLNITSQDVLIGLIVLLGFLTTVIVSFLATKFKKVRVMSSLTIRLCFGWLTAVFVLFPLGNYYTLFSMDVLYWTVFSFIFFLPLCAFSLSCTIFEGIMQCLLNSYAVFFGIQIFMDSNMIFIIKSHFYRITVANYGMVNGVPEPDVYDIVTFVALIILAGLGFALQRKKYMNIGQEQPEVPVGPRGPFISRWTKGSDEVFESPISNSRYFGRVLSIYGSL